MERVCSRFVLSGERACDSLLAQPEQFLALRLRSFQPALNDCATLLSLRFGEIEVAHHATHAAARSHSRFVSKALALRHPLATSLHSLNFVLGEADVLYRRLWLRLLRERHHSAS